MVNHECCKTGVIQTTKLPLISTRVNTNIESHNFKNMNNIREQFYLTSIFVANCRNFVAVLLNLKASHIQNRTVCITNSPRISLQRLQ